MSANTSNGRRVRIIRWIGLGAFGLGLIVLMVIGTDDKQAKTIVSLGLLAVGLVLMVLVNRRQGN